jgi:hypothetical protein
VRQEAETLCLAHAFLAMNIGQVRKLIDPDGKRVVDILLPPEANVPWHVHIAVVEYCYCVRGHSVFEREGSEPITLHPGKHCAAKEFGVKRGWRRLEVTTPSLPEFNRTLGFYERQGFSVTGGHKLKCVL